ncbi:MAG: hypothetical protein Q4D98_08295 [Planctomycetia bacterium]|nr:hypothetical protein [Planctomycetia bacterium]
MRNDFIQLAWAMNQNDPCWVPPLVWDVKEFLDPRRHPFYGHGRAEKFIAYRNGKPVGRILVSDDPLLNSRKKINIGAWGMFECVNDVQVAQALFRAAKKWSSENFGRTSLIGPMDYSTNYAMGLLTDGFQYRQRYGMNHNPRYYQGLVEKCGLRLAHELYAWWFDDARQMLEKWGPRAQWLTNRTKIQFRSFDPKHFDREVELCKKVYNVSLKNNWNYAELTDLEMSHLSRQLIQFADPSHIFLAFDGDVPVGFSVTIPDLNEAIGPLNGRLLPFGWLQFLWLRRRIRSARVMVLCVDPRYRYRGISELLVLKTLDYGRNTCGYSGAELGWTYKDNDSVNHIIERVGGLPYKTYCMYECGTDAALPEDPDRA